MMMLMLMPDDVDDEGENPKKKNSSLNFPHNAATKVDGEKLIRL